MKFSLIMKPEWNAVQQVKVDGGTITVAASSFDFPRAAAIDVGPRVLINFIYDFSPSDERLIDERDDDVTVSLGAKTGRIMRIDVSAERLQAVGNAFDRHFQLSRSGAPEKDLRRFVHYRTLGKALPEMAALIESKLKELRATQSAQAH